MTGPWQKTPCVTYERRGAQVRLRIQSLSNHELREVLVGLWSRLDRADQEDHIRALQHYLEPGSYLSPLASVIRDAGEGKRPGMIDVAKLIEQEMRES